MCVSGRASAGTVDHEPEAGNDEAGGDASGGGGDSDADGNIRSPVKRDGDANGGGRKAAGLGGGDGQPGAEHTGRLFVRNLPFAAAEAELAELFQQHGELSEVHLVQDRCPSV